MFRPNTDCWITPILADSFDRHGRPATGVSRKARCSIVKLVAKIQHTTVRADSGATRGNAEEPTADVKLLFPVSEQLGMNDVIEVGGIKVRVMSAFVRKDITGRDDHVEVQGEAWA